MIGEFKKFISRGNVLDLAIGVIIGGAFQDIVSSLVNNIFTPILGILFGGVDFTGLSITIKDSNIMYGMFIQSIVNFLLVAFCLFLFMKFMNRLHDNFDKLGKKNKKEEEKKEEVKVVKSNEEVLLEEIRNLLKDNKKGKNK